MCKNKNNEWGTWDNNFFLPQMKTSIYDHRRYIIFVMTLNVTTTRGGACPSDHYGHMLASKI